MEFPRCAVCRITVIAGQQLIFRTDGRVEHAQCPPVTCPVCERDIRPHDPIRREGEHVVHGNCWARRAAALPR